MVLLVPFDGTDLSKAALDRATDFAEYTGESVLALSVVPQDTEYAIERGWAEPGDSFDPKVVGDQLRDQVEAVAPNAEFRCEVPEDVSSMASAVTDIVRTIREVAHEVDASIVFIGSENAGRVSSPVCSVGAPVSKDPDYDVHIVRYAQQPA